MGSAVISGAGKRRAKSVIHGVGPFWRGAKKGGPRPLAAAVRRSLERAIDRGCRSVAFPAMSMGATGDPMKLAADVAFRTTVAFLRRRGIRQTVRFVLFDSGRSRRLI